MVETRSTGSRVGFCCSSFLKSIKTGLRCKALTRFPSRLLYISAKLLRTHTRPRIPERFAVALTGLLGCEKRGSPFLFRSEDHASKT